MSGVNVGQTIAPKSDQLNADDLIAGPITVKIVSVTHGTAEGPIRINLEGRLPYYPCKSMRRVLVAAWGEYSDPYVGRFMTLYRDPEVKYGGIKVGGIRISHLSDIQSDMYMALTVTRGKRAEYKVHRLDVPKQAATKPAPQPQPQDAAVEQVVYCTDEAFDEAFQRMSDAITSGRSTFAAVVEYAEKIMGKLTDDQKHKLATGAVQ